MLKYMAEHSCRDRICAVEVEKETKTSVWVKGRRLPKRSKTATFFGTWEDAHAHLTAIAEAAVTCRRNILEHAEVRAGKIREMKRPADQSN